ncbi:MAG: DUF4279 domain-containing protein [Deltaproteobacteria bacterium]|nr:DUF4279 domain-containing protein [Deltaproteobacteria bacterium]
MASPVHMRQRAKAEWRCVSLTLVGRDLNPDNVSNTLRIRPDDSARRGESFGAKRKTKFGLWSLDGRPSSGRIHTQMKNLLQRIEPAGKELRRMIDAGDVDQAYMRISFQPSSGIAVAERVLPAELVAGVTSLGIDIVISVNMPQYFEAL